MEPETESLTRGPSLWENSLELLGVGGWSLDVQTGALHWTDQVYRIHELEPGTPMSVEEAIGYYAPEARRRIEEAVAKGMAEGEGWDLELPLDTARGRRIWVRAVGRPEHHEGRLVRLYGAFQDITEDRAVRAELEEAHRTAEKVSQAKSDFLASMSHEIRTPLSAILGFLDLASEACDPQELTQYLATIRRNADHLKGLLGDILDLSKIEAGRMVLERVPFSVRNLVEEVAALHRPLAEDRGLSFEVEWISALPSAVLGDPMRLRQVLDNLVSNALKFTQAGSVGLSVELLKETSELRFEVRDTGIGMSAAAQARLFEAFTQAEASTTRRFGGTGLGLSICRRIVQALGGRIEVQSALGEGSLFRVTVPCVWSERLTVREASQAPASEEATLHGRTVILADDGEDNQRLFRILLEREGVRVIPAKDGVEALELVDELGSEVDLMLLDMHMPRLDGFGAARRLRAEGSSLPLIALTANATALDRRQCLEAGCDDYLPKPIRSTDLLAACRRQLSRSSRS